ncbi:MAG: YncE family protein [Isosphaeraceae bacterium]
MLAWLLLLQGRYPVEAGESQLANQRAGAQVPVALAWGSDRLLRVALREARQVVTVDPARWDVVARVDLPFRPSSLAMSDDRETLLVGGMDGELLAIASGKQRELFPTRGRGPARILALRGSRVALASNWDPEVRVIDFSDARIVGTVVLPFAPGALARSVEGRWIVASAFGGELAEINHVRGTARTRVLDGVNLRALALSGDGKELLVGHMSQYNPVPVTRTNIDWGLVLSSRLSAIRLSEFDDTGKNREGADVTRRRLTLDGSGHGAADPSAIAVSADGALVMIALSGAHQVLKNDRRMGSTAVDASDLLPLGHNQRLETVEVGRSPVDLVFDPTGEMVVTADSMSDSLTVVRVADLKVLTTVQLGRGTPEKTPAQRGEAVFLDGRRALDRWMSCASCHALGHTNGLNFDTLGDESYGAAKNTPSLLGVSPTAPFAWTGRFTTLRSQIHQSLTTSLHGPTDDDSALEDLTAYVDSLQSPPPRRSSDDPDVVRGATVFQTRRCQTCHRPSYHYTAPGLKDVGLEETDGSRQSYNPPTLRGAGWTSPYFHDGRARTLDEVIQVHAPGRKDPLGAKDASDLKAFLESL